MNNYAIQSEQINEITAALAKAQGAMKNAEMDGYNPHFKSHYATLASLINAAKAPLSANGLAVSQVTSFLESGSLALVTTLSHSSGQWLRSFMPVVAVNATAQAMGSGMSYARRYSYAAIVGLSQEDDDGNIASQDDPKKPEAPKAPLPPAKSPTPPPPRPPVSNAKLFQTFSKHGVSPDQLAAYFQKSTPEGFTERELGELRLLHEDIQAGKVKAGEIFPRIEEDLGPSLYESAKRHKS